MTSCRLQVWLHFHWEVAIQSSISVFRFAGKALLMIYRDAGIYQASDEDLRRAVKDTCVL